MIVTFIVWSLMVFFSLVDSTLSYEVNIFPFYTLHQAPKNKNKSTVHNLIAQQDDNRKVYSPIN